MTRKRAWSWWVAATIALHAGGANADIVRGPFSDEQTTAGNVGFTVTNHGRYGNDFRDRAESSFEFPAGSGQEHMVRAGLWIGGIVLRADGGLDTLVTTGSTDGFVGASISEGTEFTPLRDSDWITGPFLLRSRQPLGNFSIDAIADEEIIALFDDSVPIGDPAIDPDPHIPLDVRVRQESLVWSFEPFADIVFLNFEITNEHPERDILDLYVGFYAELATGNKTAASRWPPPGAWFGQKDLGYVDSLRVVTEHRPPFIGDELLATTWGGFQLLGVSPGEIDDLTLTLNVWDWDPNATSRDEDHERYDLLRRGEIDDTAGNEAGNIDPIAMLSVGPFPNLGPAAADTLRFSIAFLGGIDQSELVKRAREARDAFEAGFRIPVPTVPDFVVVPDRQRISLWWEDSPEKAIDPQSGVADFEGYRIYVSRDRVESTFELVKEADLVDEYDFDPATTQEDIRFNTGLGSLIADEPLVRPNALGELTEYRYRYDLVNVRDGFPYFVAVTAFDKGNLEIGPLESGIALTRTMTIPGTSAVAEAERGVKPAVFPNPYRGDAEWDGSNPRDRYLWFVNLPRRCVIRIYTLGGDLVDTIDFDGDTYAAADVRGIYDPADANDPRGDRPVLAGGMAAWDTITRNDQAIATGLYLFSVEDRDSGARHVGQFLVIK